MEYKVDYINFQNEINRRGIKYLVHFTETINLLSILENNKIYSRARLEKLRIEHQDILDHVEFNDKIRLDELKDFINLSISFPNFFLFSRFREKINWVYINWCVIKINPQYIYAKETLFSVSNAASNASRYQYHITGDYPKFLMLFKDNLSITSSLNTKIINRLNLSDKYPTDVQAEVLVKDEIEYSDIVEICFQNNEALASAKAACDGYDTSNFCIDTNLFTNKRE